jgi:hypothetical protein
VVEQEYQCEYEEAYEQTKAMRKVEDVLKEKDKNRSMLQEQDEYPSAKYGTFPATKKAKFNSYPKTKKNLLG